MWLTIWRFYAIQLTTKTEYWWWNIFSRTREYYNHPQTIWTVIVSAPNGYRSFSRERTHLDLEDPNGVSEWDIGLPTRLVELQRWYYWFKKFLWLHMSLESLDSRWGHAVPCDGFSMSWNHSLKNNPFRTLFRPLLMDARDPSWGFHRETHQTP